MASGESDSYYHLFHTGQDYDGYSADLWQDKYYAITASHCSGTDTSQFGHTFPGTVMGQFSGAYGWVADKYYDPPLWTGTGCPAGKVCRFSDAAAYTLRGPYCHENYSCTHLPEFATAFRTTLPWGDSVAYTPSKTIDSVNGPWSIGSAPGVLPGPQDVFVGDSILKIGRNTGTTRGFVVNTCANENEGTSNIVMLCQDVADLYDVGGDSGAGVFVRSGSNSLYMAGLSWGGGAYSNGVEFDVFAPWSNVQAELRRLGHLLGPWY
jgi:hypothetical protein